jgi:amino acid permease
VAGASLVLALISWLIAIIRGDEMIKGWVIMFIGMVLISVLLYYSLIARWFNRVLLNVINPISFKQGIITYSIERVGDIN